MNLLRAIGGDVGVMHDTIVVDPLPRIIGQDRRYGQDSDKSENCASFHPVSIASDRDSGLVAGRQNAARVTVLAFL